MKLVCFVQLYAAFLTSRSMSRIEKHTATGSKLMASCWQLTIRMLVSAKNNPVEIVKCHSQWQSQLADCENSTCTMYFVFVTKTFCRSEIGREP